LKNEKLGKVYYEFRKEKYLFDTGIDTVKSFSRLKHPLKELIPRM
jgi:hypothetical protein